MFVILPTLPALEAFWAEHRQQLPFAATGIVMADGQDFLNEYEWVFAPTIPALVKAATRWNEIGIEVEWYDWATAEPEDHASYFAERDQDRRRKIEKGIWSEADQKQFDQEGATRTPETYRGWWRLTNLPSGYDFDDWFHDFADEISDPRLPPNEVAQMFQTQTFENWRESGVEEVDFHDADSLDEYIAYWRAERDNGAGYYGEENEQTGSAT